MGLKWPALLALVVILSAASVALIHDHLARRALNQLSGDYLKSSLDGSLYAVIRSDRKNLSNSQVLAEVSARLSFSLQADSRLTVYGLNPEGQVVAPPARRRLALPPPAVLQEVARQGQGLREIVLQGKPVWLAYNRLAGGDLVVVAQNLAEEYTGPFLESLNQATLLAMALLVVLVSAGAVWLARRQLTRPLIKLTSQAQRVSSGDLTPASPLAERGDEMGRLSSALALMTQRVRQMVEEARASQARFQRLFDENRDATYIIGPDGRLVDVNPAAVKIFGFDSREQMLALDSTRSLFVDQQERRRYIETLNQQHYVQDYPLNMRRRDGTHFQALDTATKSSSEGGHFGMLRDVTREVQARKALKESEERHRRLLEHAPDIIFRWSIPKGRFSYVSPAADAITGLKPEQIIASPGMLWDLLHPHWRRVVALRWGRLIRGRGPAVLDHEYQIMGLGGKYRWVRERSLLVRDEQGQPLAVEGLATDITERKEVERAQRQAHRLVETTLHGLPLAIVVIDQDHKVVHWNRAMEELTGVPRQERVGTDRQWHPFYRKPRPLMADLVLDNDLERIKEMFTTRGLKKSTFIEGGFEAEGFFSLGGRDRHLYFLAAPIYDEEGQIIRAVETMIDLSEKRRLEEKLRLLSVTDDLTGLYNQRYFFESLSREVEAAHRHGHALSLVLMDIDKFKNYNDRFGHLEGDKVLSRLAQVLSQCVRQTDMACRYGGEELVVIMPHTASQEAEVAAERIRRSIAEQEFFPSVVGQAPVRARITASVGVARLQIHQSMHDLVRAADKAMYQAKSSGGNQVGTCRNGQSIFMLRSGRASL